MEITAGHLKSWFDHSYQRKKNYVNTNSTEFCCGLFPAKYESLQCFQFPAVLGGTPESYEMEQWDIQPNINSK